MKTLLFLLFLTFATSAFSSPLEALENTLGIGDFHGRTEDARKCHAEITKRRNGTIEVLVFNPRLFRFIFTSESPYEEGPDFLRISLSPTYEDGARITHSFVIDGNAFGVEREFCTYKCWVSMKPCLL